jgi:hypothetical protein
MACRRLSELRAPFANQDMQIVWLATYTQALCRLNARTDFAGNR